MQVGDVVLFYSEQAGYKKFHLCVCIQDSCYFLFINSPKSKAFAGDFRIDAKHIPFLDPTKEGYSIVSCNRLLRFSTSDMRKQKMVVKGKISKPIIKKLVAFIEGSTLLNAIEKTIAIEGLSSSL